MKPITQDDACKIADTSEAIIYAAYEVGKSRADIRYALGEEYIVDGRLNEKLADENEKECGHKLPVLEKYRAQIESLDELLSRAREIGEKGGFNLMPFFAKTDQRSQQ